MITHTIILGGYKPQKLILIIVVIMKKPLSYTASHGGGWEAGGAPVEDAAR